MNRWSFCPSSSSPELFSRVFWQFLFYFYFLLLLPVGFLFSSLHVCRRQQSDVINQSAASRLCSFIVEARCKIFFLFYTRWNGADRFSPFLIFTIAGGRLKEQRQRSSRECRHRQTSSGISYPPLLLFFGGVLIRLFLLSLSVEHLWLRWNVVIGHFLLLPRRRGAQNRQVPKNNVAQRSSFKMICHLSSHENIV